MKRIWFIAKQLLLGWGILCAIAAIVVIVSAAFQFIPGSKDRNKTASKNDIRYVLNWCSLGDGRTEEVLHSHISARSFTGDYLDAHAIRISHVEENELKRDDFGSGWFRGDQTAGVLNDALGLVGGYLASGEITWFPSEKELRSSEYYVYPWSIYCHGTRPTALELIFVRPKDKMVFFFGAKT